MALPVSEGLCVYTNTITGRKRGKVYLSSFNQSPSRCPICDQGGECDYKI
jgi:NADH dehydrogenase/NADH:ubiquinone oxidoreductase subunit G